MTTLGTSIHHQPPATAGFTLVELAVVLIIMALLVAGMMVPLSAQMDIRNVTETQKTLNDAREALTGFTTTSGRLPCPATAASNGVEAPVGGGICTCISPECFLPAVTLGIAPINASGQAVDGWQFPIRYAVTSSNANAFSTTNGIKNQWGSLDPDLQVCESSGCATPLSTKTVAVLWSTGKNSQQGGTSTNERENPNPNTNGGNPDPTPNWFVSRTSDPDFDDIVVWLSPNILYNRLISAGTAP